MKVVFVGLLSWVKTNRNEKMFSLIIHSDVEVCLFRTPISVTFSSSSTRYTWVGVYYSDDEPH